MIFHSCPIRWHPINGSYLRLMLAKTTHNASIVVHAPLMDHLIDLYAPVKKDFDFAM